MLYKLKLSDGVIIIEAELYSKVPVIKIVVSDVQVRIEGFWENENLIKQVTSCSCWPSGWVVKFCLSNFG